MTLIVEDGTGLNTANAYVSESYVDTYHDDRNNTAWTDFTPPEKQAAIIRATDYIDKRFGRRFRGFRRTKEQALEWPRLDAEDDDGFLLSSVDDVPRNLEKAAAEYALRAAVCGVLAPDPVGSVPKQSLESGSTDREDGVITGEISRKKEKVGPIEEETWYDTRMANTLGNLGGSARSVQSGNISDFNIPEYPEADMWIEELIFSGMVMRLVRA